MDLLIDRDELLELLQKMISIESINPTLAAGGGGESEIAWFLAAYMGAMGLEVRCQEAAPSRVNVIGILRGSGEGRSLMLNGHTDTVSTVGMNIDPLEPRFQDGRVYGRGSLDMKGGLAAMIMAVKSLMQSGVKLQGDVILALVADEEYASLGTEVLVREYASDAAIICEPTDLKIVTAHKGFVWSRIEVHGRAAHGSRPDQGIDAIVKAGRILVEIGELGEHRLTKKTHPLLGSPSIHASLITGGTELSTYPDYCKLELERRIIPGESMDSVRNELQGMIDRITSEDNDFDCELDVYFHRPPLEVSIDQPVVKSLSRAYAAVLHQDPIYAGQGGWMDSAILAGHGIPAVIFGPQGDGLHAAVEYVDFASVVTTAEIIARTIIDYCGMSA